MAAARRTPKSNKSQESWSKSLTALGIRAIDRGQLVHFGLIIIGAIIAYRIESKDWVEIAKLAFSSGFFAAIGWFGFIGIAVSSTFIVRSQKQLYSDEMDRVCKERNELQTKLNGSVSSSNGRLIARIEEDEQS